MRSPLNSRTDNRPERVASDEAFVLVAWSTVMVCPFVSQVRFDHPQRRAGLGDFQAQRVSHFLFFGLQIGARVRRRADLARKPLDDLDAVVLKRAHLAWVVGQQANARDAKVVEDCGPRLKSLKSALNPRAWLASIVSMPASCSS